MKKIFLLIIALLLGCSEAEDLKDIVDGPPDREEINQSIVGVNAFFNEPGFGTIDSQYSEIKETLGLKYVRVLFAWTDGVQPTPGATPNYGLYDRIIESIPEGVDVLIVLVHTPNWMQNPANWVGGNPRTTFVEKWIKPTVARYAGQRGIIGWEIWNEPDLTLFASDARLGLETPENYIELLRLGSAAVRNLDPTRLVVGAATRSIQQNYSGTLNYNKRMKALGAEGLIDIWNVHYYGRQFENVLRDDGVGDFLRSIDKPIWITESGAQGPNNQLAYVEQVWPFLTDEIPGIERIYYYQFNSRAPIEENYGLRTNNSSFPVSDLYVYLRDN